MAKKQFASSVSEKRAKKNGKPTMDRDIDFSDIPESSEDELKKARRVGRPSTGNAKQLIALRISPVVLSKLRKLAEKAHKPYQTYIHEILEKIAKRSA